MSKIYVGFFTLLSCIQFAFAQNPTISITDLKSACAGSTHKIPVEITGKFNAGNVFKVQLRKDTYDTDIREFPAVLNNGNIEVTFTDAALSKFSNLQLRIVATSPATQTDFWPYSFQIHTKGSISIAAVLPDTVNRYEKIRFTFTGQSTSEGIVTLSDSNRSLFYGSASNPELLRYHEVFPTQSHTYTIAHAENFCGAMAVSGQAQVAINAVSVRATTVSPQILCPGSDLKVDISTEGGNLPATAQYKLRFIEPADLSAMQFNKFREIPATFRDGAVLATIPENFAQTNSAYYQVAVVITNPNIVSSYSDVWLAISPKPTARVISESTEREMGDYVPIIVRYSGPSPYTIHMSDGTEINWRDFVPNAQEHEIRRTPTATTDYFVKSIESSCAQGVLPQSVMKVTVKPGFYIDQVDKNRNYCEGETIRLHFLTNATLSAATTFNMQIDFAGKTVSVPAKRDGQWVEFKIPAFANDPVTRNTRNQAFSFRLVSANPELQSYTVTGISIQSKPTIQWAENNTTSFPGPTNASFAFFLVGGPPYDVTLKTGETGRYGIYQEIGYANFYVSASGAYGIQSVSNSCFKNEDLPVINLKIQDPSAAKPYISVIPSKHNICYSDSLEIDVHTAGQFNAGNVFEIQMTDGVSSQTFNTFAKVTANGKMKVKVPYENTFPLSTGVTNLYLRVASSNPLVYSEEFVPTLHYPLTQIRLSYPDRIEPRDLEQGLPKGQINYLGSIPSSMVFFDGKKDSTIELGGYGYYSEFVFNPAPGANHFVVKSLTSVCGTQDVNLPMNVAVLPYAISVSFVYGYPFLCHGSTIKIPFQIVGADAGSATFSLQVAPRGGSNYTEIGKGTSKTEISGKIPENMPEGQYDMRIISSDGVIANGISATIGAYPAATLSVKDRADAGPVTVNAGEGVYLQLTLTGTLPQWVVSDGADQYDRNASPSYYYVYPFKSAEYTVRSVRNACGYGVAQGNVQVKVQPKLRAELSTFRQCAGGSLLLDYSLTGDSDLSDDYIRFELLDISTMKSYRLDSTKVTANAVLLKIPETLAGGNYEVITSVKKYDLAIHSFVQLETKPDLTLIGTTVINPGFQTNLVVKSNVFSSLMPITFTLSDGYTGQFSGADPTGSVIAVSPAVTTEYSIVNAYNQCGQGVFSGKAIVQVNAPSERTTAVTDWNSRRANTTFCTSDSIQVYFTQTGSFSAGNRFTVELSDSTGQNFRSIPTIGNTSPLTAVTPASSPRGTGYRLRVAASDAGTASAAFKNPLELRARAIARFATDFINYEPGKVPKVAVLVDGEGPYAYNYGSGSFRETRYGRLPADTLTLTAVTPPATFTLLSVQNVCGTGIISLPSTVRVEVITGIESPSNEMQVIAMPNPTSDAVSLKFQSADRRQLSLYNLNGQLLLTRPLSLAAETIDVHDLPAGIFILKVEFKNQVKTFRIVRK